MSNIKLKGAPVPAAKKRRRHGTRRHAAAGYRSRPKLRKIMRFGKRAVCTFAGKQGPADILYAA
jgi:hypothetical protein